LLTPRGAWGAVERAELKVVVATPSTSLSRSASLTPAVCWSSSFPPRLEARVSAGEAKVTAAIGALRESIEARDFRLDDHGRRMTAIEEKLT
jgi:hypothetical protein